jgi:hypothetical protein
MNVLERWSERTGKDRYIAAPADYSEPIAADSPEHICGWYAQYKEGLFAYWLRRITRCLGISGAPLMTGGGSSMTCHHLFIRATKEERLFNN